MASSSMKPLPFIDLAAQQDRLRPQLDAAMARVLDHGAYLNGPEVVELESALSVFCGAKHTITCSSGTDALLLALMALDCGPGQAVFVPAFTFTATAEAPAVLGATPVFVDVDPVTFTMDAQSLKSAILHAREIGLTPAGVIPVDLFGLPADYNTLSTIAAENDLWIIGDAAQSFGAHSPAGAVGTLTAISITSFFPAKPLGAYGDGGAVFTSDDQLAEAVRLRRVHGQGPKGRDDVRSLGLTARLDTLQAAVLGVKLSVFADEIDARNRVADRYAEALADVLTVPQVPSGYTSVWAQYTVRTSQRDKIAAALKAEGIPSAVYYSVPVHRQRAYTEYPMSPDGLPVTDALGRDVLSLPMHPYLTPEDQARITDVIVKASK